MAFMKYKPIVKTYKFGRVMDKDNIPKDIIKLLDFTVEEQFLMAFKSKRDFAVFTNKRIFVIDTIGISGTSKEYFSLPYKNISTFSIRNNNNRVSIFKVTVNNGYPMKFIFTKAITDERILEINDLLSDKIL